MASYLPYDLKLLAEIQDARAVVEKAEEEKQAAARAIRRARISSARLIKKKNKQLHQELTLSLQLVQGWAQSYTKQILRKRCGEILTHAVSAITGDPTIAQQIIIPLVKKLVEESPPETFCQLSLSQQVMREMTPSLLDSCNLNIEEVSGLKIGEALLSGANGEAALSLKNELERRLAKELNNTQITLSLPQTDTACSA